MSPEVEMWSPEQDLRLLEEIAEREAKAFEVDLGPALPPAISQMDRVWVAYWQLPRPGLRLRARNHMHQGRGR
ncbi:MAG: hypothetical protein WC713_13720 [Candidatus Methylomirabilota bacterium]